MRVLGLLALLGALLLVGMLVRQQLQLGLMGATPAALEAPPSEPEGLGRPQPQQLEQVQQALEKALQQSTRRLEDID